MGNRFFSLTIVLVPIKQLWNISLAHSSWQVRKPKLRATTLLYMEALLGSIPGISGYLWETALTETLEQANAQPLFKAFPRTPEGTPCSMSCSNLAKSNQCWICLVPVMETTGVNNLIYPPTFLWWKRDVLFYNNIINNNFPIYTPPKRLIFRKKILIIKLKNWTPWEKAGKRSSSLKENCKTHYLEEWSSLLSITCQGFLIQPICQLYTEGQQRLLYFTVPLICF